MSEIDLRVRLPLDMASVLRERYSFSAVHQCRTSIRDEEGNLWRVILIPCPLCEVHCDCEGCPFERFGSGKRGRGCMKWMSLLMRGVNKPTSLIMNMEEVRWKANEDDWTCEWLDILRYRAAKYIKIEGVKMNDPSRPTLSPLQQANT